MTGLLLTRWTSRIMTCFLVTWASGMVACELAAQDSPAKNEATSSLPRKSIEPFSLPAASGKADSAVAEFVQLPERAPVVVLCFLGTECPLARQYAPRLQKLADDFQSRGVVFLGIDSNLQDSAEEVARFRSSNNLRFPIGMDYDQKVAGTFQVTRTPEVVVLDATRAVRYQGRIDDQYLPGVAKPQPTVSELADAITAVLAGETIRVTQTQSVGCLIGKPRPATTESTVTYSSHIAKIFNANCIECHRSGEIGPFAMTDYEELRGWGDMIVEVINDGRMPPWHAAPDHGRLRNTRFMAESDKQLVREWVAAGMPYGKASEVPPPPVAKSQWHLPREPDLEVVMRSTPYEIPAEGTVDYQYFVVDPGLTEDRWVSAAQVIPGNPGVVHHAIIFIRPPDDFEFRGVSWLTAYVPGQRHNPLPPGSARRIPAGSKFVFQMHYTPNGTPQQDATKVGMLFVDPESVDKEVITMMGINQGFEIPPGVADHPVLGRLSKPKLPSDGTLLAFSPHMHVRGKAFQLFTVKKDEQPELFVDVPHYDFNWQHTYVLADPLPLNSIDALEFVAHFDNSSGNPVNPNPNTVVTWGDQTWEEMAVAFFEISHPRDRSRERSNADKSRKDKTAELTGDELAARNAKADKFAQEFLDKLDKDHDGIVGFAEAPLAVQRYSFHRFDRNNDHKIDRDELVEVAKTSAK